ncbi:AAA family ATPase, partial [Paenibacillus sp. TAF58]
LRVSELNAIDEELKKIEIKISVLNNKESFEEIQKYLKINTSYQRIINALSTQKSNITKKQNEATTKLQIEKFNELFNKELLSFNYKLHIDSKVKKGRLDRKYFGEELKEILSEGEKNLLGLADFFAEINYYENNKNPIILDDPITSFDLEKIDLLADRIIKESKVRQVIIFTHSKPFLTSLRDKVAFEMRRGEAKCKICSGSNRCNSTTNIYCSKWYEVYSYNGISGVLVEILPYETPKHLKDRVESLLGSPSTSTIGTLEGYLYLRLMIELFIDTCLLNSVRSRLDPESDKIQWDKLPGLKILKDVDGKTGSESIIRKTYSKISGISVHIDKRNQALSFDKSDLLYDLEQMKTMNSDFSRWYESL